MIGVTPRIMREGMRADYRQVDRLSQQLCERMQTRAHADGADRRRAPTSPRPSIPRWRGSRRAASSTRATGRTCRPAKCSRRRRRSTARSCATAPRATTSTASTASSSGRRWCSRSAAGGWCRRAASAPISSSDFWSLLPHRRQQRSRRRAGVRHQPRAARDDRHPAPGREGPRRAPRVRRSLRQPDARRLVVEDPRRRADPRLRRVDRRRAGDCRRGSTSSISSSWASTRCADDCAGA